MHRNRLTMPAASSAHDPKQCDLATTVLGGGSRYRSCEKASRLLLDVFRGAVQNPGMNPLSNFVSLHPYFKVHPGKLEIFTAAFPGFVASRLRPERRDYSLPGKTASEENRKPRDPPTPITSGWVVSIVSRLR